MSKKSNEKKEDFISLFKKKQNEKIIDLFKSFINYLEDELSLSFSLFSSLAKEAVEKKFYKYFIKF